MLSTTELDGGATSRVRFELLSRIAADDDRDPREEVMTLVEEAVHRPRIDHRDDRLVALHRVFGFTNIEIARIEGCQPCTVRKRRVAAEAAVAQLAVAEDVNATRPRLVSITKQAMALLPRLAVT